MIRCSPGACRQSRFPLANPFPAYRSRVFLDRDYHRDRKSTRLNSSHSQISYAVFCLKKKKKKIYPLYKIPPKEVELARKLIYSGTSEGAPLQKKSNHFAGVKSKTPVTSNASVAKLAR